MTLSGYAVRPQKSVGKVRKSTIDEKFVIEAGRWLYTETLEAKLAFCDEVAKKQPRVLQCVLSLHRLEVSPDVQGHAINILLFFYDCFSRSTPGLPLITDAMLDDAFDKTNAMLRLIETEPDDQKEETIKQTIFSYCDLHVLAMYSGYTREKGMNQASREHEIVLRTLQAVLNAFLEVRRQTLVGTD